MKQGRKTESQGEQTLSLYFPFHPRPAPSASLAIRAHRWLNSFDVNVGQLHCSH